MAQTWKDWPAGADGPATTVVTAAATPWQETGMRMAPGSEHARQSTTAGCVLFVVSSLRDEILERPA